MAAVVLEGVHKRYPGGAEALRGVDLRIEEGELVVLVGPSGCGKSTALRVVAGLETPSAGRVWIGEREVTELEPRERDVAMVFQSYALYPHRSVRGNLAFGLRMRGIPADEIARRIDRIAGLLGIGELLGRRPAQLSGGQRQRVALGRALVREPRVFLLDEPLSNLDALLRVATRAEIGRLHRQLQTAMLYVTHDQEEAMTLGQRIAVMREGRIEQLGPPLEIYEQPATPFVAEFIGTPAISWLGAELVPGAQARGRAERRAERGAELVGQGWRLPLPERWLPADLECESAREVRVGVRAHDWLPGSEAAASEGRAALEARVELVEPLGASALVHAETRAGELLRWQAPAHGAPEWGSALSLGLSPERVHVFDAQNGRRLGAPRREAASPRAAGAQRKTAHP